MLCCSKATSLHREGAAVLQGGPKVAPYNSKHASPACSAFHAQVIYCGGGTMDCPEELREFARRTGIPLTSTLMGLGAYSSDGDNYLGMLGMHGTVYANYAVDQVRLVADHSETGWRLCDNHFGMHGTVYTNFAVGQARM